MDIFIDPALVHGSYETGTQNDPDFDAQVKHEDNNDVKEEEEDVHAEDEEMQDLFGDDDADEKEEVSVQDEPAYVERLVIVFHLRN